MNKIPRFLALHVVLPGLLTAPLAQGADQPLDEVLVEAKRGRLLQEMVKLEDRFFERYNELNTNDDFDTRCYMEARVGTRLERRFCRAVFQERAMQIAGSEYTLFLQRSTELRSGPTYGPTNDPPPVIGGPPLPAIMEIEARRKDYQENIRQVVRQHPELLELLRQRFELGQRYEAARGKNSRTTPPAENGAASAAPLLP